MEQYHDAPHTLDSERDIDEDAPPSAGHDEQAAEVVRERDADFTEGVQEERERLAQDGEVGPGDPTLEKDEDGVPVEKDDESKQVTTTTTTTQDSDVPDGTIGEVLDWVGDDPDKADRALQVERTGQNRSSLISELEKRSA
jgi:hypothetical protein